MLALPSHLSALSAEGDASPVPGAYPALDRAVAFACRIAGADRGVLILPVEPNDELEVVSNFGMAASSPPRKHRRQLRLLHRESSPYRLRADYTGPRAARVPVPLRGHRTGYLFVARPLGAPPFGEKDRVTLREFAPLLASQIAAIAPDDRFVQAREQERQRVAQELHDEAGHVLTGAILQMELAAQCLPDDAGTARAALLRTHRMLLDCATAFHNIVAGLSPQILDELGLVAALRHLTDKFGEHHGTPIALTLPEQLGDIEPAAAVAAYRVVQEGLTNAARHARARHIWVRLESHPGLIVVVVEDDGIGLPAVPAQGARARLGVAGMRERAVALGGRLTIGPREGGGVRLVAQFSPRAGAGRHGVAIAGD